MSESAASAVVRVPGAVFWLGVVVIVVILAAAIDHAWKRARRSRKGRDGRDGEDGCDGKDGRNGSNGCDGKPGCKGKDGQIVPEEADYSSGPVTLTAVT